MSHGALTWAAIVDGREPGVVGARVSRLRVVAGLRALHPLGAAVLLYIIGARDRAGRQRAVEGAGLRGVAWHEDRYSGAFRPRVARLAGALGSPLVMRDARAMTRCRCSAVSGSRARVRTLRHAAALLANAQHHRQLRPIAAAARLRGDPAPLDDAKPRARSASPTTRATRASCADPARFARCSS